MNNPIPSQEAAEPVQIVEVLPTKIWIENGVFGERAVMVQHEGMEPFEYAVFNYRYGYTDNLSTVNAAESVARSLGATEPIEHRHRSLPPTVPSVDHQTERGDWWVLEFRSIAVVEGEPGRIVSRELFPSREAANRAADDCEFSSRFIPLSDLLAPCFAGGSPARDVEAPAAINQDVIDAKRWRFCSSRAMFPEFCGHDGTSPWGTSWYMPNFNDPPIFHSAEETADAAMLAAAPTGADT